MAKTSDFPLKKKPAYTPAAPKSGRKAERRKKQRRAKEHEIRREDNIRLAMVIVFAVLIAIYLVAIGFKVAEQTNGFPSRTGSLDTDMLEINPDYAGWLMIDDTILNYPVAHWSDNVKYLNTTFEGKKNNIGAIFMDYRTSWDSPHVIIYGHNIGDLRGNKYMFGGLRDFLNDKYRAAHPVIEVLRNGELYEYEIFAARAADIRDPAYFLNFSEPGSFEAFLERNGASADETQVLTLSTCAGDGSDDRRVIVQGVLRSVSPAKVKHGKNGWTIEKGGVKKRLAPE